MIFGLEIVAFLSVFAIFLIAGTVKGVLGFGLPLITMSLLPFVIPVELAIVLSALVQPATNIGQLISTGGARQAFYSTWTILLALIPSVALGAWFLSELEGNSHLFILGLTLIGFAVHSLSGFVFRIAKERQNIVGGITGFVAGIVGMLTSINGMFFIMYLVGIGAQRNEFRAAIALLFIVSGVLINSGFWFAGLLNQNNIILGILVLIPCFTGMWLGNIIGNRIPNEVFRKMILYALLVIGCVFIWRGL
jgi:uncharacterized membrane protein YfcA